MFIFRSLFWMGTLVMLLPPAADGSAPAPRTSFYEAALAARTLLADLSGMCERNPVACDISRDAVTVVGMKVATGAGVVVAGVSAGRSMVGGDSEAAATAAAMPPVESAELGTLTPTDLQPAWVDPQAGR